ncbi:MAG: LysM peptidoglycan-binding domain-containing M23 family metallopeptidase [Candidatus Omnitrophica bacterium]|nr:LysM peptidoglycan-binding domain-containing M23 family metallopeptidase [Candidatus Omnitrophota bacterium]
MHCLKFSRIVILLVLSIAGCVTLPEVAPPTPVGMSGVYHRIEKGQTLWRISKLYNVELDELVRVNRITDVGNIRSGQLIFIPYAKTPIPYRAYSTEEFTWPLSKGSVLHNFGEVYNNMINKGIHIRPSGDYGIRAARSGKVVFYTPDFKNYGKTLIIDHGDNLFTVYAGNMQAFVKTGEYVQKGSIIAKLVYSQDNKDNYLHFEIRKGNLPQNPLFYLP